MVHVCLVHTKTKGRTTTEFSLFRLPCCVGWRRWKREWLLCFVVANSPVIILQAHRNCIDKDQPTLQCSYRHWCDILMLANSNPVEIRWKKNVHFFWFCFECNRSKLERRKCIQSSIVWVTLHLAAKRRRSAQKEQTIESCIRCALARWFPWRCINQVFNLMQTS